MKGQNVSCNKKTNKFDVIKHLLRKVEGLFEVVILTIAYFYVWKGNYRIDEAAFYGNGKFVLTGIYAFLIFLVFYLCDSFKFGHMRMLDVVISQFISMFIVNFITYFQVSLISNYMVSVLPMIVLTAVDFALSIILVYIFNKIYRINNVPRDMVLVYGQDVAVDVKFKIDSRLDKYRITKIISIDKGFDEICSEINKHDAVVINDVPAQIRNDILKYCYDKSIRAYIVPKISDIIVRGGEEINLFDTPLFMVKGSGLTIYQRFVKRAMDIVLSLIALVILSPFMLVIAAAIKIEDGGSVFYRQDRVTRDGKVFSILKFRSMKVDAESGGYSIPATGEDPRILKSMRIARRIRADETANIFNILRGEMSIVGPRPERVEHVKKYNAEIPEFNYRHKVKAGLTGYAQIYGKYNTSAYDKVRLDLMYIEKYSILLDIKIIFMTLRVLLKPEATEGFEKVEELEKKRKELLTEDKGSEALGDIKEEKKEALV